MPCPISVDVGNLCSRKHLLFCTCSRVIMLSDWSLASTESEADVTGSRTSSCIPQYEIR